MESFNEKMRSLETATESKDLPIFPEYDSIDELAEQIRLAEDAGHTLQPTACFEIGILLQETRNLMQSIYRSFDYCQICMADDDIKNSCKEPLLCINTDIVACRLTEAAIVHGFDSHEYQMVRGQPSVCRMVHRSFGKTEFPMLSKILPLSQLRYESILLKRSNWLAFIEDENTHKEAADILRFYIYWALERNERSLIDLVSEYLKRFEGPWTGLQRLPDEMEKAMDDHKLFMLIMRRVHFALVFLSGYEQYRDLFSKIQSIQPPIPGGMEQCTMWLQRLAGGAMPVEVATD